MSLKDLFKNSKTLSAKSLNQVVEEIEEPELLEQVSIDTDRFQPHVDFSEIRNFARYGLAEKYYQDSFDRIRLTYPYDGSLREKKEWKNNSTHFDLYIYDNIYPKSTGYLNMGFDSISSTATYNTHNYSLASSPCYIYAKGTMNTGSYELYGETMEHVPSGFDNSNKYDLSTDRYTNLRLDPSKGNTVEFWLQQDSAFNSDTSVIFDIWNGEPTSSVSYGRMTLELLNASGNSNFLLTYQSGSDGFLQETVGSSIDFSEWQHYAISTYYTTGSAIAVDLYINGIKEDYVYVPATISEITGAMNIAIGAFQTAPDGSSLGAGWGGIDGSIDEFRFWRSLQSDKNIKRFWFTSVNGGSNVDDIKTDLGLYYKFNEGVSGLDSIDSIVLDYSGRTSNGRIYNYSTSASRSVNSAMVMAGVVQLEKEDPVLWEDNPDYKDTLEELLLNGRSYDYNNNSSLYYSFPSWIIEEEGEDGELKKLCQIIGSYFDELHNQIKELPTLKEVKYVDDTKKAYPFSDRLLTDLGAEVPEIFSNAKQLEKLFSRNEEKEFKEQLDEVKNTIYSNIYNNIIDIYKSKGTEKAIRNYLRCFGINENLVKIKYYADLEQQTVRNNFEHITVPKKFLDFSTVGNFNGTVYQDVITAESDSVSYISGSGVNQEADKFIPFSLEAEIVLPKKYEENSVFYNKTLLSEVSSSIFGLKIPVTGSGVAYNIWDTANMYDFRVFVVKDSYNTNDAKFVVESDAFPTLETDIINNVYDNTRWNIAVRVTPEAKLNAGILDSAETSKGLVEFYGISTIVDQPVHEFQLSTELDSTTLKNFLASPKKVYAGAYRTNWTGSVINRTDIKLGSLRYWTNYLDNETIKLHNIDPKNYGDNSSLFDTYITYNSLDFKNIPDAHNLALNWEFSYLTSSDSLGGAEIYDLSSGSSDIENTNFYNNITRKKHTGNVYDMTGDSTTIVDKLYLSSGKQRDPENIGSFDMIKIMPSDEVTSTQDSRPINHIIRFEKSMAGQISENMLEFLGSVNDFNNFVGSPSNRYTVNYKYLDYLKQLFFDKVENTPDFEKFTELYKWIDSSMLSMLKELIPASALTSGDLEDVVESHIFERNKYHHKLPSIDFREPILDESFKSVGYFQKLWSNTHHPISNQQSDNFQYWNKYSIAGDTNNSSSIDLERQIIRSSIKQKYDSDERELANLNVVDNNSNLKLLSLYRKYPIEWIRSVENVSAGFGNYRTVIFDDELTERYSYTEGNAPFEKNKVRFIITNHDDTERYDQSILPFSIQSSSVETGYQSSLSTDISGVEFNNYHLDTYGRFVQQPMQGPFTNFAVGGNFHRANSIATGNVDTNLRVEGWRVVTATNFAAIFSPWSETGAGFDMTSTPYVGFYRDMGAKSIVNTKNIKVNSPGNYYHEYELISGPENKHWLVENPDGLTSLTAEVSNLNVTIDFEVPEQNTTKKLFKQRFSAPGSLNETSIGYLDPQTQQYGIYSTQPYRNLKVRRTAINEMSEHFDISDFTD